MKQKTKLMMNSLWYRKRIDDPLEVIQETFSTSDILALKNFVKDLFTGACQNKPCINYSYGDIIFYLELVESLLNAAFLLDQRNVVDTYVLYDFDLYDPKHYCGRKKYIKMWDYAPKHLSLKEYINPYSAFHTAFLFCPINEWKERINLLAIFAFDMDSLFENNIEMDMIGNYTHLSALLEATHLLDVRHELKTLSSKDFNENDQ